MGCWCVGLMERGMTGNGIIKGLCVNNATVTWNFILTMSMEKCFCVRTISMGVNSGNIFRYRHNLFSWNSRHEWNFLFFFKHLFADYMMVVQKKKCTFCLQFLDAFTVEHATQQQLTTKVIISGEAFVILWAKVFFIKEIFKQMSIKCWFPHTPDWGWGWWILLFGEHLHGVENTPCRYRRHQLSKTADGKERAHRGSLKDFSQQLKVSDLFHSYTEGFFVFFSSCFYGIPREHIFTTLKLLNLHCGVSD